MAIGVGAESQLKRVASGTEVVTIYKRKIALPLRWYSISLPESWICEGQDVSALTLKTSQL